MNNRPVSGKQLLHEKDVIVITNSKLIFSPMIAYCCYKSGISVDAADVVITRGKGKKSFVTGNHISLNIRPGELVAVVGGSGAGKSTILNCLCGYLPPDTGEVFINGSSLYQNFDSLKKLIGYVPRSLTLCMTISPCTICSPIRLVFCIFLGIPRSRRGKRRSTGRSVLGRD